jgi:hypothetical protein
MTALTAGVVERCASHTCFHDSLRDAISRSAGQDGAPEAYTPDEWWVDFCGCACCSRKRLDSSALKSDW